MPTPLQERGQRIVNALKGLRLDSAERSGWLPDPKIGVALGGGSARGLIHIPYIEAMDDLGLTPSVISGCSIGAAWPAPLTMASLPPAPGSAWA